jgi:hypothetical protein
VLPALTGSGLSVFVIPRFAVRTAVVAIELLFPVLGSAQAVEPEDPDVPTFAVFVIVPVAPAATVAVTVNVATAPALRVTELLMLPEPLGAAQALPGGMAFVVIAHVQLTDPSVGDGNVSVTEAAVALSGPLFVTTMVYVRMPPRLTGSGLSLFEIDSSARSGCPGGLFRLMDWLPPLSVPVRPVKSR